MSGTNRTVMSKVVMASNSQSALTKALTNANQETLKNPPKKAKKK